MTIGGVKVKRFDVKCPACGKVNRDLFLEETNGCFECDNCGIITMFPISERLQSVIDRESGPYEKDTAMHRISA